MQSETGQSLGLAVACRRDSRVAAQYDASMPEFIPADFDVPREFAGSGYRLEPLGPQHNERDYDAWTSSMEHIRATPGFAGTDWPHPMSLDENLADLEGHARDFAERTGFTYSILDGADVIGCIYIYPSPDDDSDAAIKSWVRSSRAEMDGIVRRELGGWIESDWPFTTPKYAGL